jgi:hypothetical protein
MDRDPSRFATPADQLAKACAKCTCLEPHFDVVTLLGHRHSEFCCACGLPGDRDVVSGDGVVAKSDALVSRHPAALRSVEHKTTPLPRDLLKAMAGWTPWQVHQYALTGEEPAVRSASPLKESPVATAALKASVVADGFRGGRDVWAKAYERALNRVDVTLPPGTDLERVPKDVADKAIADAQARATADRTCHGTLSPAYAHAPGALDAYAIGQAPGERWPHPMGEFDEGFIPKPWRR